MNVHLGNASLLELGIPRIVPVASHVSRPLWSVMIPTYNCALFLQQTIESVLTQAPGPELMQIEVVDDCSTADDAEAVVKAVGKGRVGFYRKVKNEGATANFNTCVERSRGKLVHILHGDDYVLPRFYSAVGIALERFPEVGIAVTRSLFVDEQSGLESVSPRIPQWERPSRDISYISDRNRLVTPSVVIRRAVYEKVGGFCTRFNHVADWEMWTRVISSSGCIMLNELLCAFRVFPTSDTGKLRRTGDNLRDCLRLADLWEERGNAEIATTIRAHVPSDALSQSEFFKRRGDIEAAKANLRLYRETRSFLAPAEPLVRRLGRAIQRRFLLGLA